MSNAPLQCSCGSTTFSRIQFPEPMVQVLHCAICAQRISLSLSAIAAEMAWEKMEQEAPEPEPQPEMVHAASGGYRYGGML